MFIRQYEKVHYKFGKTVLGFKNMPAILQQKQNFGCFLLFRNGNSRCYALYWHTFELY
jgi:hypothetical protein